jgi:hypothetical protein
VVNKAHALGFKIVSYQILGLPNETLESMIQTLAFNAQLPVLLGASPFYRTPSAPIARGLELNESDFLRARLTALGVEHNDFSRDEIYTLFVITRVVNFLKGLPIQSTINLSTLMATCSQEASTVIGLSLLKQLLSTGVLCFWTKKGLVVNRKFQPRVFLKIFSDLKFVSCQNGGTIVIDRP